MLFFLHFKTKKKTILRIFYVMSHKNFGPDRFSRLLDPNNQTNRQTSQIYIQIEKNEDEDDFRFQF